MPHLRAQLEICGGGAEHEMAHVSELVARENRIAEGVAPKGTSVCCCAEGDVSQPESASQNEEVGACVVSRRAALGRLVANALW